MGEISLTAEVGQVKLTIHNTSRYISEATLKDKKHTLWHANRRSCDSSSAAGAIFNDFSDLPIPNNFVNCGSSCRSLKRKRLQTLLGMTN